MKLVETIRDFAGALFSITFRHRGFERPGYSTISEALTIMPDPQTMLHFHQFSMGFSFHTNTLVCFIRCRLLAPPALQPKGAAVVPTTDTRFRFLLKASSHFLRLTEVKAVTNSQAYYFSNRDNAATDLILSHDAAGVSDSDLRSGLDIRANETLLGVIDIFSGGAVNASYDLFKDSSGELKSPAYHLTFLSSI